MNINKRLLILFLSLIGLSTFAQTAKKSLNYQAVILDPKAIDIPGASIVGQPLNKGNVCLRFSLLNAQGGVDYEETQQVTTDEYGLVNVAIGTGTQVSSNSIYKSFENIVWNASVKSLKVSVSYDGCSSFKQVSTQALNYTPYSLYAEAVEYKNVREAPTKLSQFSNDSGYLIPKDLDPIKSDVSKNTADIKSNTSQIATANQTIADNKKSSDAAFLIANQNITSLDTKVAANTTAIKENTSLINTINTKLVDQQNQISDNRNQISSTNTNLSNQIGGLQGQINTTNSTVSNLSGSAEAVSNKSTLSSLGGANPSDQLYPSQKAAKAYVDNAIYAAVGTGVADATTLAPGKVQLSGDLGGTAASPTVPALANKENLGNKSTSVNNDAGSDTKYPSVKAVKTYVDLATMGTALQTTVDGKADKVSPTFTGTPVLPTGTVGVTQPAIDNSTKLATTAFVQQATAGIALQTAVDLKAPIASPTFTGTPSLPAGTTGVTQAANDNSTKLATTEFVNTSLAAGAPDATTLATGKIQLAGELSGTATSPTLSNSAVIGKVLTGYSSAAGTLTSNDNILQAIQKLNGNDALKAPLASPTFTGTPSLPTGTTAVTQATNDNSTKIATTAYVTNVASAAASNITVSPTFTGTPSLPTGTTGVTQAANDNSTKLATTAFVASSITAGAPDATTLATGKIQLSGELSGTATSPTLSNSAVIGKVLTGYSSGAGTLTSGDNILQAIQKLNGNDALKAPLASPTFTGTPSLPTGTTAVTQATNDNSTKIATTAYVTNVASAAASNITSSQWTTSASNIYYNSGTVGVGTSTPAASAKLDITSTIQGFLPPRMTQDQRDAISSPAQGLMLYCTDCGANGEPEYFNGTTWVNMIGGAAQSPPPTLGRSYQGGIIFYILQSGDPGYDALTPHGLIAAKEDQSNGNIKWDQFVYHQIPGINDGIGYGSANTTKIINDIGSSTLYAAGLARAYRGGGYSDWYVPSQDELNQLYIHRSYFTGSAAFTPTAYWSSSQFANWAAIVQDLNFGWTQGRNRGDLASLRAIRSF